MNNMLGDPSNTITDRGQAIDVQAPARLAVPPGRAQRGLLGRALDRPEFERPRRRHMRPSNGKRSTVQFGHIDAEG